MFKAPEQFRVDDAFAQKFGYPDAGTGNSGLFILSGVSGVRLFCISSDQGGWEHVSISRYKGKKVLLPPVWGEMDYVKRLFWSPEAVVMQLHPAVKDHINIANSCLHLWRSTTETIPLPPLLFV